MKMALEMLEHLENVIVPFWDKLQDKENGGFYGYMTYNLELDKTAEKGCILNSRILWFYSATYNLNHDKKNLKYAEHAYNFLKNVFLDKKYGGVFWMADYTGKITDSIKHTYNQAFAIYALAEYYKATKNEEALDLAKELFEIIEMHCKDMYGYLEEFDEEWNEKSNEMLSECGVISKKTTNTHLHVLEAYTNLYSVWKDERVKNQLLYILDIFKVRIYDENQHVFKIFFDEEWNVTIDVKSFGHDIETCWLIDRAAEVIGDKEVTEDVRSYIPKVAAKIHELAYSDHGMNNECVEGKLDTDRIWWVQAEAVIGFYNNFQITKDKKYCDAAMNMWDYIKSTIVDKRNSGEWFWKVSEDGQPYKDKPIVEPWKCPYHNSRMCIEIVRRTM
ncbi:AGE family epimerase/isomerase [Inconstantimicrobium mannanitabidum]|uniref:Cellobiose 2-epimerase n=1 Tax=Inconstantimicrobium mannanitabidum TaxID=1604901 RepID=A0ACB5R797_9CLOT|nr:AGE family epimerase/isomerase [Clostridium sp. TW13]GKX65032.1 cellobiose 2-epimerase [Clostridium sp. TW13]